MDLNTLNRKGYVQFTIQKCITQFQIPYMFSSLQASP